MKADDELEELLRLWRATRDPRVAALVRAHPDDTLVDLLSRAIAGRPADAAERVRMLVGRDDPRVLDAALAWFQAFPHRRAKGFWDAVFELLASVASPDLIERREVVADAMLTTHTTGSAAAVAARMRRLVALPADLRSLLPEESEWLEGRLRSQGAAISTQEAPLTEEALLDAIARDLDDDAPRRVLADLLLERGDPRGAFVAAQLEGLDPPLRQEQIAAWAGPWLAMMGHVVFSRGFPDQVTLTGHLPRLPKLVGDPHLRTVRAISMRRQWVSPEQTYKRLLRVLRDPVARNVTSLEWLGVPLVEAWADALGSRIRVLGIELRGGEVPALRACRDRWVALEALTVDFAPDVVATEVLELAAHADVATLGLSSVDERLAFADIVAAAGPGVREVGLRDLRAVRGEGGWSYRYVPRDGRLALADYLQLPDGTPVRGPVEGIDIADPSVMPGLTRAPPHRWVRYTGPLDALDPRVLHPDTALVVPRCTPREAVVLVTGLQATRVASVSLPAIEVVRGPSGALDHARLGVRWSEPTHRAVIDALAPLLADAGLVALPSHAEREDFAAAAAGWGLPRGS
ncbi:MAG: TIGR02996 domain-containing protein [Alphaproteobacteria bacterium]|nr:TIGR02996 domain-containing protein [Alphaproteobacteria bacterium]